MKKRRYLLTPRQVPAYGQDFLLGEGMESIGISRLLASKDGYASTTGIGEDALFISHNTDDPGDSSFLTNLPAGTPVVTHVHLQWGYIDSKDRRTWARRSIDRANCGVVPAPFMKEMFSREFPDVPWKIIKYGLNEKRFRPTSDDERNRFRKAYGLGSNDVLIIHVGALTAAKGLRIIRRFISGINSAAPRVFFLLQFLGNAKNGVLSRYQSEANDLQCLCQQRVRTLRDKNPLSTDRPLRYCDLLVTTSLREVCPLVVLEAFLSGVPVVSFNSTPFFEELRTTEISERFHIVLQLPERFQEPEIERGNLDVSEKENKDLSNRLLEVCNRWNSPTETDRYELATQAREAGFTLPHMLTEFDSLYDEVSRS